MEKELINVILNQPDSERHPPDRDQSYKTPAETCTDYSLWCTFWEMHPKKSSCCVSLKADRSHDFGAQKETVIMWTTNIKISDKDWLQIKKNKEKKDNLPSMQAQWLFWAGVSCFAYILNLSPLIRRREMASIPQNIPMTN